MDLSLNVTSGGPTARGSILRSNQAYLELVSQKTTLDYGIAFCAPSFPGAAESQQFREVWVESVDDASRALTQTQAFFDEANVHCNRWALAEDQEPDVIEPVLFDAGFARADKIAMMLERWPHANEEPGKYRILPARAMRQAFRGICTERAAHLLEPGCGEQVTVDGERLDDHRLDAFVAMDGKQPVGLCSLFQVGDIGRIIDLYVAEPFRRRGIGTEMLEHIFAMARRLAVRIVCVDVPADNPAAVAFLEKYAFVPAGKLIEYARPFPTPGRGGPSDP